MSAGGGTWRVKLALGILAGIVLLAAFFIPLPLAVVGFPVEQVLGATFLGWHRYLWNVLPGVRFDSEAAVHSAVALLLATIGLHGLIRVWRRLRDSDGAPWRFAATLKVTALLLLLCFATSIAATGIVHQFGWLAGREPVVVNGGISEDLRNMTRAKNILPAMLMYAGDHGGKFPDDLEELVPEYVPRRIDLYVAGWRVDSPERFAYFREATDLDAHEDMVLSVPQLESRKARGVVFRDGTARRIREAEYQGRLAKREAYLARTESEGK